jgi:hypothetical protein
MLAAAALGGLAIVGLQMSITQTKSSAKYAFDSDINASGSVRASGVALSSDRRWKKNITPLRKSLEKIKQINGVSYDWNIDDYPEKLFTNKKQIGVIAQNVQAVFPELVLTDAQGFLSVNYPALVAPLIEAVKEQQKEIAGNVHEIDVLKAENVTIKKALCELGKKVFCK